MGNGLLKERPKKRVVEERRPKKEEEEERFFRPSQMEIALDGFGAVGKSSLIIRFVLVLFFFFFFSFSFFFFFFLKRILKE